MFHHVLFILTDSYTGNQRYIFISTRMTWLEAQAYCRQHHTDLASSRVATEDSFIKGLTSDWTWFGLFRDSWKWTDQTNFSTITWMTGKPDNALGNENCGYINNSQAADARCSDIMPFFCYSDVTGQQQTLRVKVQSSEDVNEPSWSRSNRN
ncbi:C-type lectin-like [Tachysurus fulvidraco]|uniref:C-type lectin-like n=1 Tax=Tachysurus fulvidraco TaxID=1234273 RepID=UPI001FED8FE2|nr:C-type lectin-like [Tachysurus fulvidraco]